MSLESQATEFLQLVFSMDDKVIEENFDNFLEMFNSDENFEKALYEKLAYCRANNLTEDDLIEENKSAKESLENVFENVSKIKKDLLVNVFSSALKINEKILENGLFPKVNVRVQKLSEDIELPKYAHYSGDSGLDLKLISDIIIKPQSTVIAPTGLKVAIPLGYEIQIRPRSGNSIKYQDLFVANSPGTIDANYREELGIILRNIGDESILLTKGTKIAQAVLCPVIKLQWVEVDDINDFPTERKGGFGSTGA